MLGGWIDYLRRVLGWPSVHVPGEPLRWSGNTNLLLKWGTVCEDTPPLLTLAWVGSTNLKIKWAGKVSAEGGKVMQQYRYPVRADTPQRLEYTFRDRDRDPIDLSAYTAVKLMVKRDGGDDDEEDAEFLDAENGKVVYDSYSFETVGEWTAQFAATMPSGGLVYGEPIRFKVVKNIPDLTSDELPEF